MKNGYKVKYRRTPWEKPKTTNVKSANDGGIDIKDLRRKTNNGYICGITKYKPRKRY